LSTTGAEKEAGKKDSTQQESSASAERDGVPSESVAETMAQ
jgi:hypothetical protein